jgi:Undecaprenyl-phosphate glucose phosphotransferase
VLYRYSEVFRTLLMAADLALVAAAWLAAYWLRFHAGVPAPRGVPPLQPYLHALVAILPVWFWLFRSHGLYEPRRTGSLLREVGSLLRATAIGVVVLVALAFFYRGFSYSRGAVLLFACLSPGAVLSLRVVLRVGLRSLRRRGRNLRYVVVVGGGPLAEEAVERIHAHPEAGLRVRGVFTEELLSERDRVRGVPVLGPTAALKGYLAANRVDQVIVALPREEVGRLDKVLADLDDEIVCVKLVVDLRNSLSLRSSVEDLDGLPVINLREGPMVGWAAVQKRVFDVVLSSAALVLTAPLMALVALAIRLGSGSPVLYSQERVGLDGRVFRIWKFRSMAPDAEHETGPVWAQPADARRTRLGAWLRRLSLDELPQLWNVLRGDMSLVGPRPERPVFIEEFRRRIPGYMLRHHVKAGMTGWAQVHGWRGATSLHERLEHDIYYIQNWSLGFDVRILLLTGWRVLWGQNAH